MGKLITITYCAECDSDEVGRESAGDESFRVCRNCMTVEGGIYETEVDEDEIV